MSSSQPTLRKSSNTDKKSGTANEAEEDQRLNEATIRSHRYDEERPQSKNFACGITKQCCFITACVIVLAVFVAMFYHRYQTNQWLVSELIKNRRELDEERGKRKQVEEIRLKENQLGLQLEGKQWMQRCIAQDDRDYMYNSFTGVRLFWGLMEIGYASKQQVTACFAEYNDRFPQRLQLN